MSNAAVYRFYDDAGELLYVGLTNNPNRRFSEHADTKAWWHEVDETEIEWFTTRFEAEAAESVAIWQEEPRYNIVSLIRLRNRPKPAERADQPVAMFDSMSTLFDRLVEDLS